MALMSRLAIALHTMDSVVDGLQATQSSTTFEDLTDRMEDISTDEREREGHVAMTEKQATSLRRDK